jgi:hypothetical protein
MAVPYKDVSMVEEARHLARLARKFHLKKGMEGEEGIVLKGSLVVDLARIIRANKEVRWDKYLVPPDWEIINGVILISDWYPIGAFRRMGNAVFREMAGSSLEDVHSFGKASLEYFLKVYENIIVNGSPIESLKRLFRARKLFVKGNLKVNVVRAEPGALEYFISRPAEVPEKEFFKALCYASAGVGEAVVLRAGGGNESSRIEESDQGCKVTISWELSAKPRLALKQGDVSAGRPV